MADNLRDAFVSASLPVPEGLFSLLKEDTPGADGRRRVYGRIWAVLKANWPVLPQSKRRVVWPMEVREAVREEVKRDDEERGAGSYDRQYDEDPMAYYITLAELSSLNWDLRPQGGGKAMSSLKKKRK